MAAPVGLLAGGADARATEVRIDFGTFAVNEQPVGVFETSRNGNAVSDAVSIALRNTFKVLDLRVGGVIGLSRTDNRSSCFNNRYSVSGLLDKRVEARRALLYPMIVRAACDHGLAVGLFDALVMQESRYNMNAISKKGAVGLAQLMPQTAAALGVNPYSVSHNLGGGARYLRKQLDRFGAPHLALAAYNAGPERVARAGAVPNIKETKNYVATIISSWSALAASQITLQRRSASLDMTNHGEVAPALEVAFKRRAQISVF